MRTGLAATSLLLLAGCMATQPVNYRPHYSNYSKLQSDPQSRCTLAVTGQRAASRRVDNLQVGLATMAPSDPDGYAGYMASALNNEFQKAGLYATPPRRALNLTLEKNYIGSSPGYSEIAITVTVVDTQTKGQVAQIPVAVRHEWKVGILSGAEISRATGEYGEAVADLNGKLFADPRFQQAIDCSATAAR